MGLLNNINDINRTLQENQKLFTKQLKEEEKAKNNIYIAKIELIDDLQTEIKWTLQDGKDPNDAEIKGKIIDTILEYSNIIYNKKYTKAFLIENYEKEVKKLIKQYQEEQKELKKLQIFEEEEEAKKNQQKARQRQTTYNAIITILKYTIVLLATPFILIIAFVWGICKGMK